MAANRAAREARALLPDESLLRLRRSLRTNVAVRNVSPTELRFVGEWQANVIYIVDPSQLSETDFASFVERVARAGSHLVVYADFSPAVARRVVRAQQSVAFEVIGVGASDEANMLADVIDRFASVSGPASVLNRLADCFDRLPPRFLAASAGLFSGMPIPDSVERFIADLGYAPRTAHERLRRASLQGMKRLCTAARVSRVFPTAVALHENPQTFVLRGDFTGSATLTYAFRHVFDSSIGAALSMPQSVAVDQIVSYVCVAQG